MIDRAIGIAGLAFTVVGAVSATAFPVINKKLSLLGFVFGLLLLGAAGAVAFFPDGEAQAPPQSNMGNGQFFSVPGHGNTFNFNSPKNSFTSSNRAGHFQYSFKNIVSPDSNYRYAVQVSILTDQVVNSPGFVITCDKKIEKGIGQIPGQMIYTMRQEIISDDGKSYGIKFASPAFTPEAPFVITVFSHSNLHCDKLRDARLIEFRTRN